jgi:hypothetical protein
LGGKRDLIGLWDLNTTPIGHRENGLERADLQFRGEFFNLFNIVNMGLPANAIEVQDLA